MSDSFWDSFGLMVFILNPFLLIIYLIDLVEELDSKTFAKLLIKASLISFVVYMVFGYSGEIIFKHFFQSNFASFRIFGGIILLITAIRFVFEGNKAMKQLRGEATYLEGGIVMPIMVGPGTISASIIVGKKTDGLLELTTVIFLALFISVLTVIILKMIIEKANKKNEKAVLKYTDILGRVGALLIGTFSVEMIANGIIHWVQSAS